MNSITCPTCQTHLPPDAPHGLCPQCLLLCAVDGETSPPPDPGSRVCYFGDFELLEEIGRGPPQSSTNSKVTESATT